jgi:hypothetical protein
MPNFTVRPTSSAQTLPWEDPPLGERASRVNPSAVAPHRHYVVPVRTEVVIAATPNGGAEGDLDVDLDGALFMPAWFIEAPYNVALWPAIFSDAGHSSVQRFTPYAPGHYTLIMRRNPGGFVIIHFDVEPS